MSGVRPRNGSCAPDRQILLKHLDDPAIERAYVAAGGLCLPHFRIALSHAGGGASRTLAQWQAATWRQLRGELDELIRKHDYRFADEKVTEAEADAWQRAVAALVGAAEIRDESADLIPTGAGCPWFPTFVKSTFRW